MPDTALIDGVREIRHRIAEGAKTALPKSQSEQQRLQSGLRILSRNKDLISKPVELNNERKKAIIQ